MNRWIAHETASATREVTEALEAYRFNDAAGAIYRFVWNVYCDWYVELAKPVLMGEDGAAKAETRAMVAWARDEILKLLHPFMPFITEELWAVTAKREGLLALAPWPRKAAGFRPEQAGAHGSSCPERSVDVAGVMPMIDTADFTDPEAEAEIGWVVDLVTAIRSVRAEMNIPPATLTPLVLSGASAETKERAPRWNDVIKRMARLSDISFADRGAGGRGATAGPRRGCCPAAQGRDRSFGREDAARQGDSPRPRRTSAGSMPNLLTKNSSPTRPKRSSRRKRRSARRRWRERPRCWRRWSG